MASPLGEKKASTVQVDLNCSADTGRVFISSNAMMITNRKLTSLVIYVVRRTECFHGFDHYSEFYLSSNIFSNLSKEDLTRFLR